MGLGMEAGEGMLPPTTYYYLPFSSQKSKIVACATASKTAHWSRWINWCRIELILKKTPSFWYGKRIQSKYRGKNWELSICCMVEIIFEVNTWWYLTLKDAGGGVQNDPLVTDKACMPSIFIKTPQIFFWWKLCDFSFHQNFFWEVEDDRNRP